MKKIALVGNPNSGKSTVFNLLTGLSQHVGNYPGVTVDKHIGTYHNTQGAEIKVTDLPGTYSIFPRSSDERVTTDILLDRNHADHPHLAVVITDATNLERNLLIYTQLKDLDIPSLLVLNMMDLVEKEGKILNTDKLAELLSAGTAVAINARNGDGLDALKDAIDTYDHDKSVTPFLTDHIFNQYSNLAIISADEQIADTNNRFRRISQLLKFCISEKPTKFSRKAISNRLDKIATHPIWGYSIFLLILLVIFQFIFEFANVPMDLIDSVFLELSQLVTRSLPPGVFTDLLAEGIIPGIGGIVIFIPQIVLLFAFLALLEESGYMSRVVFIMDRLMRPFGLTGKSVVPLMSGVACAIPAIMATRSIDQWKDRLVTILVVPLTSCSARLPVYTLLIALVVPQGKLWGVFNYQGLALLFMYTLGFVAVILASSILKVLIKTEQKSFLIMEMPTYKIPKLQNVLMLLLEKTRLFIWEAGRIIMAFSIILWGLASYGPDGKTGTISESNGGQELTLEDSFVGHFGKAIEPVIKPLGYDWKIGIALITSFAAREVFVSSMATIYSVGEDFEEDKALLERMRISVDKLTGQKTYTFATGFSLMVFYAFAMQCMSTLAIVKRETKSWKWPVVQLLYMTLLAYFGSLITYQLLS
ncbi:MAG: ferrous iron transport protein B [Cyclobacteriaceae bacterium]